MPDLEPRHIVVHNNVNAIVDACEFVIHMDLCFIHIFVIATNYFLVLSATYGTKCPSEITVVVIRR